jgi:hypothetical protein
VSPRKSSTSSGNRFDRPRYLLVEVTGAPPLSARALEEILRGASPPDLPPASARFRVIRTLGRFGLVAVAHLDAPRFRSAWTRPSDGRSPALRTLRTYGTLRKGKEWIARANAVPGALDRAG